MGATPARTVADHAAVDLRRQPDRTAAQRRRVLSAPAGRDRRARAYRCTWRPTSSSSTPSACASPMRCRPPPAVASRSVCSSMPSGPRRRFRSCASAWPRAECASRCSVPASGGASSGGCCGGCIARWPLVDDRLAFVGGINIIDDRHHPGADGADIGPRYDFAVACEGPLVSLIAFVVKRLWWTVSAGDRRPGDAPPRYIELSTAAPGEHARRAAAAGQPAQPPDHRACLPGRHRRARTGRS